MESGKQSAGINLINNLREDQEERQRLEKSNFDLKMKVYYLEESLKRFQAGEQNFEARSDSARTEIMNLKYQLESKESELEQRNILLMKAKNTIEILKSEREQLKTETEKRQELENRVNKLKILNDEMGSDFRSQVSDLEIQLQAAKQILATKEQERIATIDKLNEVEIQVGQLAEQGKTLSREKHSLEEKVMKLHQVVSELEDELGDCKGQLEIMKIQAIESEHEREDLKAKIKDVFTSKIKADEDNKSAMKELVKQYELQIQYLKSSNEKDVASLREIHHQTMNDLRHTSQAEVDKLSLQHEKSLMEVRHHDTVEASKLREEHSQRYAEKVEEVRSLRMLLESGQSAHSNMLQELETLRADARKKQEFIDQLRFDLLQRGEELKHLDQLRNDLNLKHVEFRELNEKLHAAQLENVSLKLKCDESAALADKIDAQLQEQKEVNQQMAVDMAKRDGELVDLAQKANHIEKVTRDNERLLASQTDMTRQHLELSHKLDNLLRDNKELLVQQDDLKSENAHLSEANSELRQRLHDSSKGKEELLRQIQAERELKYGLEVALAEQRKVNDILRSDMEKERGNQLKIQQDIYESRESIEAIKHNLGMVCQVSFRAMLQWEDVLTYALDGDTFHDIMQTADQPFLLSPKPIALPPSVGKRTPAARGASARPVSATSRSAPSGRNRLKEYLLGASEYKGSRDNDDDEEEEETLLSMMSSEELLAHVTKHVERINMKMERVEKIRRLFQTQAQALIDQVLWKNNSAQERVTLLSHQLAVMNDKVGHMGDTVHRNQHQRDSELREMKNLREVILLQHSAELKNSELHAMEVMKALEAERLHHESLKAEHRQLEEAMRALEAQCAEQKEHLARMEQLEAFLTQCNARMNELSSMNSELLAENSKKHEDLMELQEYLQALAQEKKDLQEQAERLSSQLQSREDLLSEYEQKLSRNVSEIERLRAYQINPVLAQTIMDTQNILQSSVGGGGGGVSAPMSAAASRAGRGEAALSPSGRQQADQLHAVIELTEHLRELVDRTGGMLGDFEAARRSGGSSSSRLTALEQEVFELLEANARLSSEVHLVAADLKKMVRKAMEQTVALRSSPQQEAAAPQRSRYEEPQRSPSNGASFSSRTKPRNPPEPAASASRGEFSSTAGRFYAQSTSAQQPTELFIPSRRGLMTPTSNGHAAATETSRFSRTVPTYEASSPSGLSPGLTASVPRIATQGLTKEDLDTGSSPASKFGGESRFARAAGDIPAAPGPFSRSTSGRNVLPVPHRSYGSSAAVTDAPNTFSDLLSTMTPNTAAKTSMSRLNKLGADLQALAKKLDHFDGGSSQQQYGQYGRK